MLSDIFIKAEDDRSRSQEFELEAQPRQVHVLIIDDEEGIRAVLCFALLQAGYHVTTAADGQTVLQGIREKPPDFIILDLNLPGIDGIELCWRIREFSDVPIMMVSGIGRETEKVWGLKAGADDYLTKPFSVRELIARMEAIIRRVKGDRQVKR